MLSPSLQSYLNANDPSWAGGDGWSPSPTQDRRDPTAIYRAEIARIRRRFGLNKRVSGRRSPYGSTKGIERRSARLAASAHNVTSGSSFLGSYHKTEASSNRVRQGVVPHRHNQIEGFLEKGWDGSVSLTGTRPGSGSARRSIGVAPRSNENSRCSLWMFDTNAWGYICFVFLGRGVCADEECV